MRYKSFYIVAEILDEDFYNGLPSLSHIEVSNVTISNTPPKVTSSRQVIMREDHPFFNFDIWADDVDFIETEDLSNFKSFMGSDEVNYVIAKYFPDVLRYFKYRI